MAGDAGTGVQRLLRAAYKPNFVLSLASSAATIPLGDTLLGRSSNLPGGFLWCSSCEEHQDPWLAHRAGTRSDCSGPSRCFLPIWSCSVWGLPCRHCYQRRGALLPHLFTLTCCPLARPAGGIFSVALAVSRPSRRDPGRYPAHCPVEFGLSSPVSTNGGGRPAARSLDDTARTGTLHATTAPLVRANQPSGSWRAHQIQFRAQSFVVHRPSGGKV